jgi:hypothetical protein
MFPRRKPAPNRLSEARIRRRRIPSRGGRRAAVEPVKSAVCPSELSITAAAAQTLLRTLDRLRLGVSTLWRRRLRALRPTGAEAPEALRWVAASVECCGCRRVFAVGLAIWPVRRAPSPRGHRPFDTIPTRSELYGLRLAYDRGPDDPVNLACDCFGTDTSECALHGEDWG